MPLKSGRSPNHGALSVGIFLVAVLYAVAVQAACGCFGCLAGGRCALMVNEPESPLGASGGSTDVLIDHDGVDPDPDLDGGIAAFRVRNRWGRTATHSGRSRGEPITLTWGFAPDGTTLPTESLDDGTTRRDPSDLIAFLDTNVGNSRADSRITNLELKSWFPIVKSAYDRWSELSGLTYVYEPNDDGVSISGSTSSSRYGVRGVRADMRLSGHYIDGQSGSNTLAYNWFPSAGDMVIDTSNTSFYGDSSSNHLRLRNVLMHELGHGLGLNHLESSNSGQLMEPFISTAFDGPQIDDILAMHRNYGDALEKDGGNDNYRRLTTLGDFDPDDTWVIGADGRSNVVSPDQTDFVSIDGLSDNDYYHFTVTERSSVEVLLSQVGRSYFEGPQGGDQELLNTGNLNQLKLSLLYDDGSGVLETEAIPTGGRRSQASLSYDLEPGRPYYLHVQGTVDEVQLYELAMTFAAAAVPEPNTLLALLAAAPAVVSGTAASRRRAA